MTAQKNAASIAFDSRSRNIISNRPPANTSRTIFRESEPMSCRSRFVMASWSRLAISAASESATPNKSDQTRRPLTASPHFRGRLDGIAGGETVGQFDHHFRTLGRTHAGPASDLVDSSAAAEAQAHAGIQGTNFDARCFNHAFNWEDGAGRP